MINVIAMAELLEGEYRTAFQKIDMYATVNSVDQYEERVLNIYDMLMEAQRREEAVSKVIGNDIEEFCKEYFRSDKSEYRWVEKIQNIMRVLGLVAIFLLIDIIFEMESIQDVFAIKTNLFPFVLGFGVAIILDVICKLIFNPIIYKKKKISPAAMSFAILAMSIGGIIAGLVFLGHITIMVTTWIMLLIIVAILAVYFIICRVLNAKGIKVSENEDKAEKDLKKAFEKEVDKKATMKMIAPIMEKRYQRIKKRKAKRGVDYTMKDFQALIHKEGKFNKILDIVMILIIVLIVASSVWESVLEKEYMLAVILAVVLSVVEYGIYRVFIKTINDNSIYQIEVVDKCVSLGIALAEYDVEDDVSEAEDDVEEMENEE